VNWIQTGVKRFFTEIRQTDGVQKFNMWAVIIEFNCKEVPINPIIKPESIIIRHENPLHVTIRYEWLAMQIVGQF
jgi:hypothetical protein